MVDTCFKSFTKINWVYSHSADVMMLNGIKNLRGSILLQAKALLQATH